MASLWKQEHSPFWTICWTDSTGRRLKRSTKIPVKPLKGDSRSESELRSLAFGLAVDAEKTAKGGYPIEIQVRKIMGEVFQKATGQAIHFQTVEAWFNSWIESKAGTVGEATMVKYKSTVKSFLEFLGERRGVALASVTPSDIVSFRDILKSGGRSVGTVNDTVSKIIGASFADALRMGYITVNPFDKKKKLIEKKNIGGREPFSNEQIQSLLEFTVGTDWEGMIIGGFTTGLRLRDLADLKWSMVDLKKRIITLTTQKTGFRHIIPIHPLFIEWINAQSQGIGLAPVFKSLNGKKSGGKTGLSQTFRRIMKKAGVIGLMVREGEGVGRTTTTLSFHSLRHSFVSSLKASGTPNEISMKLSGHTTNKAHEVYTHHDIEQMRQAVESISLFGGGRK